MDMNSAQPNAATAPLPVNYQIIFFDRDNRCFARIERESTEPLPFLALPMFDKSGQIFIRNGERIVPYELLIFKLREYKNIEGVEHKVAFYQEVDRKAFDMDGVTQILHTHDSSAEIRSIIYALNGIEEPKPVANDDAIGKPQGTEPLDPNTPPAGSA